MEQNRQVFFMRKHRRKDCYVLYFEHDNRFNLNEVYLRENTQENIKVYLGTTGPVSRTQRWCIPIDSRLSIVGVETADVCKEEFIQEV